MSLECGYSSSRRRKRNSSRHWKRPTIQTSVTLLRRRECSQKRKKKVNTMATLLLLGLISLLGSCMFEKSKALVVVPSWSDRRRVCEKPVSQNERSLEYERSTTQRTELIQLDDMIVEINKLSNFMEKEMNAGKIWEEYEATRLLPRQVVRPNMAIVWNLTQLEGIHNVFSTEITKRRRAYTHSRHVEFHVQEVRILLPQSLKQHVSLKRLQHVTSTTLKHEIVFKGLEVHLRAQVIARKTYLLSNWCWTSFPFWRPCPQKESMLNIQIKNLGGSLPYEMSVLFLALPFQTSASSVHGLDQNAMNQKDIESTKLICGLLWNLLGYEPSARLLGRLEDIKITKMSMVLRAPNEKPKTEVTYDFEDESFLASFSRLERPKMEAYMEAVLHSKDKWLIHTLNERLAHHLRNIFSSHIQNVRRFFSRRPQRKGYTR